jgi:hypothetical protein
VKLLLLISTFSLDTILFLQIMHCTGDEAGHNTTQHTLQRTPAEMKMEGEIMQSYK